MARKGIVPIELELISGTFCTLWAPGWCEDDSEWQTLPGRGGDIYLFSSTAELLAFLQSDAPHDFTRHPSWCNFNRQLPGAAITMPRCRYDLIGLPGILAGRTDYDHISRVDRILAITRSVGTIVDLIPINQMSASHSVLAVTQNSVNHFQGNDAVQWSTIGNVILANWNSCIDAFDAIGADTLNIDEEFETAAATVLKEVETAERRRREATEKKREEEKKSAEETIGNPYDQTVRANAGIDLIKIPTIGCTFYTLRCYMGRRLPLLGSAGEVHTFPQPRTMMRRLLECRRHDMSALTTRNETITATNAGELEAVVREDNEHSFIDLIEDIEKGLNVVDTAQLVRAYELLADTADWAGDDAVNEVLADNQQLQWLLSFLLDTGEMSEPAPPYDDGAEGRRQLEKGLTARFTIGI